MTDSPDNPTSDPITAEQLIGLNEEIAALIRSGIPLELGLSELGSDAGGALGRLSTRLAERMSQGNSLPQAIASEGAGLPRAYGAIVEAGMRAGRLPAALEAVSAFTWELLDFRRKVTLAAMYPLTVLAIAYGLFLVFLTEFVARYESAYETFRLPLTGMLRLFVALRDSMAVWAWIPPLLLVGGGIMLYFGTRRSVSLGGFPFVGVKHYRHAMFADLLAMQIEHQVTLPEGILLSAEATGSAAMRHAAGLLADHVSQGGNMAGQPAGGGAFPPFLRWLLIDGERQGRLARALRLAAQMYRRRALNSLNWFKAMFPVVASLVIGGGIAFLYAIGLFVPFIQLLEGLSGGDMLPLQ